MLKLAIVLAFATLAAADYKFVGNFMLEAESQTAKYERILKAVGFKQNDINEFIAILPELGLDISVDGSRITARFYGGGKEVSNTFEFGIGRNAKIIVGGTAQTTVYMQSETRLSVHAKYGKAELITTMDCDDDACVAIYSTKGANLVTKWKRVNGGGDGGDGGGADENKFLGKFALEKDSASANNNAYERLFKASGLRSSEVRELISYLPDMMAELSLENRKLVFKLSGKGKEVTNVFSFGVKKAADMIIGGQAEVIVFQQSNTRLALHIELPKGELQVVWDCDDEGCIGTYSTKGANLVARWRRA